MIYGHIKEQIRSHAKASPSREVCGIVVEATGEQKYIPADNLSVFDDNFILDPDAIVYAETLGSIVYIVHSHTNTSCELSSPDRISHSRSMYSWIVYSLKDNTFGEYLSINNNEIPPLLGRQFCYGVQDCYSIIKDYYKLELNIDLPDFIREDKFWHRGENPYITKYTEAGFSEVPYTELRKHDVVLVKLGVTSVPNHGAVYTGDGHILHHVQNRLSERTPYLRYWKDTTTNILRYNSLL